jgi:hypothetical protein
MSRKRKPGSPRLPSRWDFKHGAFYYRTRDDDRRLFDGKTWFRLGKTYPEALRAFADRKELLMGETLDSVIDRYTLEILPALRPNTRASYSTSLACLRGTLGHNPMRLITPQIAYQHLDAVAAAKGMNVANNDLKVLNVLADYAVRWGVIPANTIKGNVRYFGLRDGLKKARDRYVEDWEVEEWRKVATPVQWAFTVLVLLTGARKADLLRIRRSDVDLQNKVLTVRTSKTDGEQPFEITPALEDAIKAAFASQRVTGFWLLTNAHGGCFVDDETDRCSSFDRAWRSSMARAVAETGLQQPFTRHDIRAKAGSDEKDLARAQELLGHADAKMTRTHYRRRKTPIKPAR